MPPAIAALIHRNELLRNRASMEDVLFIINPRAGSGRAAKVWAALCDRTPGLREAAVIQCEDADTAAMQIRAALGPHIRRVVVMGGDGTLHATLNLMLADASVPDRRIGLIPVGTGSDLARGLGLEMRPEQALARALEAEPVRLDALRLQSGGQSRHVINVTSLGISTKVAARVNAVAKRNALTFLAASLRELISYRPQWARIHLDGKLWREGHFYMAVAANGSHFGKGMRIAPLADPGDGWIEVVLVEAAPKALLLAWLPSIYFGKHLAAPFVHCARAKTIDIDTGGEPLAFESDGEVTLFAPATISIVPGAVLFSGAGRP